MEKTDLVAIFNEESGWVHAIGNSAANDGEQVEDDGRLVGVLEEQLLGDIHDDGQEKEAGEQDPYLRGC